jgi:cation-transporting ATPase E
MEGGSSATRAVAAIILLGDSFEAMPAALSEGQRTVGSIQNILKLFMVTVFALLLLIAGITILGLGFPFTALQNTLISFFARGAPPFVLAISAVAVGRRSSLSKDIISFTLPASFTIFVVGLLIYIGAIFLVRQDLATLAVSPEMVAQLEAVAGVDPGTMTAEQFEEAAILYTAQTSLVLFFVLAGLLIMIFAEPPFAWFAGGSAYHGRNWLPLIAALFLLLGFGVIYFTPGLRAFFQLVIISPLLLVGIVLLTLIWALVQRWIWRSRWLERFLDIG